MKNLIFVLLLFACATKRDYLDNGRKYYDSGMYHKAMEEFQLGLKVNPANADLNIGLKRSQDKIYEVELLKVRDSRLAGDPLTALQKIRELDKNMREWNLNTDINGSEFRKTELEKLLLHLKGYLASDLEKGFVLKTHKTLTSFRDVLGPIDGYQAYENEIITKGKEKCTQIIIDQKFYNIFTSKYCEYFGEGHSIVISTDEELYKFDGASYVIDNIKMPGVNYISSSRLYHSNGKQGISSKTKLQFNYTEKSSNPSKTTNYTDQESYWTTERETYWVNEIYYAQEMKCNYLNTYNPCQMINAKKTRTVPKFRDKKVKKYRDVNKSYTFKVRQVDQNLRLTGQTEMTIDGKKIIVNHNFYETYSDYEHNESSSLKGLRPKNLSLKDVQNWKSSLVQRVTSDLNYQVHNHWKAKYCKKSGSPVDQGEFMMRCALVASDNEPFLNEWSQNFSGLAYKEIKELLKI